MTSPNGSETWYYQGADQTITWTTGKRRKLTNKVAVASLDGS